MTALKRFDTLKSFNALKRTGVSEEQAETFVEMVKDATDSSIEHLASKEDLAVTKLELKEDIASVKTELKADIALLRESFAKLNAKVDLNNKILWGFCAVVVLNIIMTWLHH